jgi:hypothetical protein
MRVSLTDSLLNAIARLADIIAENKKGTSSLRRRTAKRMPRIRSSGTEVAAHRPQHADYADEIFTEL